MAISYEEFKNVLKSDLISYIGNKRDEYEIKFSKVKKINKVLDGFSIVRIKSEKDECTIAPTLYAEDFYEEYLKNGDINKVVNEAADTLAYGLKMADTHLNVAPFANPKEARDRIIFEVINTERNQELLKDLPHRDFLDLSIVYRVVAGFDFSGVTSALINYSMLEILEISEEELYDLAYQNTIELLPYKVRSMEEIIVEIMRREGNEDAEICQTLKAMPDDRKLYVITNDYTFCAANAILYPDYLDDIADEFGTDIYIIPVSVNEVMIMKALESNPLSAMLEMVKRSNSLDEVLGEVLSDNIYQFSRKDGNIVIPYAVH